MTHVMVVLTIIARIASANTIEHLKNRITNIITDTLSTALKEHAETALAALRAFAETQDPCNKLEALLETKVIIPAMPLQLRNSYTDILLQYARSLSRLDDKKCISANMNDTLGEFGRLFPHTKKNEEYITSLGIRHEMPILAVVALAPHIQPESPESWENAWKFSISDSMLGHTVAEMTTLLFREVQEVACVKVELLDDAQIDICETLGIFTSSIDRWKDAENIQKLWLYCLNQLVAQHRASQVDVNIHDQD